MGKLDVQGTPSISGNSDQTLKTTLAEPNTPEAVAYSGKEKLVKSWGNIEKYKGEFGSFRYLCREDGNIIGGLKVSTRGDMAVLSTVFVDKEYRNKGIASKLLEKAKKDFKGLKVDSNLTQDGAKFFKVQEGKAMSKHGAILEGLKAVYEAKIQAEKEPFSGDAIKNYFTGYFKKNWSARDIVVNDLKDDGKTFSVTMSAIVPKTKYPKDLIDRLSKSFEKYFELSYQDAVNKWGTKSAKDSSFTGTVRDDEQRFTVEFYGSYSGK